MKPFRAKPGGIFLRSLVLPLKKARTASHGLVLHSSSYKGSLREATLPPKKGIWEQTGKEKQRKAFRHKAPINC